MNISYSCRSSIRSSKLDSTLRTGEKDERLHTRPDYIFELSSVLFHPDSAHGIATNT
ncbi:hypothetical protein THF1C08_170143 [Vibrio jasicida]|nr:hypothetical protein THF1C08_170143 [Vibrio jasicida]